ncbi:MAG: MFS transporter [Bacteroidaceae bacterium]|jgi:MFS family permease|nr:MFS transporter [Bacteroidaceae bacterium]
MKKKTAKVALSFVILMGVVSLFSDMTHEGARSIYGAYLKLAGVSAATIGFIMGFGELIGYSLRLVTGYFTDKKRNYWTMSIIGYAINMVAIPLLALIPENGWKWACLLIIMERFGKAIRQPSKNTLVSFASAQVGEGKAFALQEFMDQIGAFCGPVFLFVILLFRKGSDDLFSTYRICFGALIIPAFFTLYFLLKAKHKFPHPENFEISIEEKQKLKMNSRFIVYIIAISLFAFGFIDFPIITMHVAKLSIVPDSFLPLLYAGAMLVDAVSALIFGWAYDKYGIKVLIVSNFLSAFFAPFVFLSHSIGFIIVGITLWGIGMGAQETILKSAVTSLVPKENRSTGFGIFETSFGVCWFLGSWMLGILYDTSISLMVLVSIVSQLVSIPLLFAITKTCFMKKMFSKKTKTDDVQ